MTSSRDLWCKGLRVGSGGAEGARTGWPGTSSALAPIGASLSGDIGGRSRRCIASPSHFLERAGLGLERSGVTPFDHASRDEHRRAPAATRADPSDGPVRLL